jgi:hypothetical protein
MRSFGYVPVHFSRLYEWGHIHVEWDLQPARTSLGLFPHFFNEFLKTSEVFALCVRDRLLTDQSPMCSRRSSYLIDSGGASSGCSHQDRLHRWGNPALLGMKKVCSEDAVRALGTLVEDINTDCLLTHLLGF